MSNALGSPPVVTGKRKRPAVSYVESNALLDDVLSDAESDNDEYSDVQSDDDGTFGTRRKPIKKTPPRKKSKKNPTPKKAKPFRFLDLPPELRDMIYEAALTDPNGVVLLTNTRGHRRTVCRGALWKYKQSSDPRGYVKRPPHHLHEAEEEILPIKTHFVPSLLAVNKQIHAEAINFLYNQKMILADTASLFQLLATIGPRNQQRLLGLELFDYGEGRLSKSKNHAAMTLLAGATNLKSFTFNCSVKDYYGYGRKINPTVSIARQIYRDAHYFLEAYGFANGRRDAAVDVIHLGEENFQRMGHGDSPSTHDELEGLVKNELRSLLNVPVGQKVGKARKG